MFSVIFEVLPNEERKRRILNSPAPKADPGNDRWLRRQRAFESRLRPGWVLSHSTWRDEKSVVRWRTEGGAPYRAGQGTLPDLRIIICASVMSPPIPIRRAKPQSSSAASTIPRRQGEGRHLHRDHAAEGRSLRQPDRSAAGTISASISRNRAIVAHDV